jgi:hypothetical protein
MLSRKLFRLGPVLLVPPTVIWAVACNGIGSEEANDWWRIYPFIGAFALAALWHLALVIRETERLRYTGYAIWHLPLFFITAEISMIYATRFPL